VRGGVPILFPNAGALSGGAYNVESRSFKLPQHGFGRDIAWSVVAADVRMVELRLAADDFTRDAFPWNFDVRLRYKVSGNTLTIEQTYANLDNRPMPLAAGFHPYFLVPDGDKKDVTISTGATRAYDNVAKKEIDFTGFDLTQKEVDLHLLDHGANETRIERPGHRTIRMSWDERAYGHLVVWTQAGKDFVCVEPWTAPADALRTGEGLRHIGPRETRKTWIAITAME
jgi:galactose mutarotase-like enzyme